MTKIFTTYGDKILSLVPQQLFKKNSFGPLVASPLVAQKNFFKRLLSTRDEILSPCVVKILVITRVH